jgi:hypothetical protein
MTKRSKTEISRFSGISRVAGFVRASLEAARATDRLAKITRQQISVAPRALVPRISRTAEQELARPTRVNSQTHPGESLPRAGSGDAVQSADAILAIHKFAANVKALDRMVRVGRSADQKRRVNPDLPRESLDGGNRSPSIESEIDSRGRSFRMIQQALSGIETLTRMRDGGRATITGQRSKLSSGDPAGRAKRALGIVGRLSTVSGELPREPSSRFEPSNFAWAAKYKSASRVHGWGGLRSSMMAPASFSRPEFAESTRGVYGQESRSTPGAITINSTPTVVINPGEAPGDVERQVISALRAHREELFDQFKRESIRRERAQF